MLSPRSGPYRDLFRQGMPASLSMLTVSLGIFVITWYLGRFGQTAVAAYGIGARIEQAAILPIMGLNIATLTLVAQNSGACHFGRVRQTVQSALRMGLILTLVAGLASFFGAPHLASIFTSDPEVMAITAAFLRFSACTLPAYLILYICTFALQGMRRPLFAVLIGSYRQILAPVPVFWLLAVHAGFGIRGIWWGILVVTWSAALLALLYMKRTLAGLAADRGDPCAVPTPGIHR
jgi:Na+-driven multidrug efflux pump